MLHLSPDDLCINITEFMAARQQMPAAVAQPLFDHLDHDNNDCITLTDMSAEFHLVDHNGENTLSSIFKRIVYLTNH